MVRRTARAVGYLLGALPAGVVALAWTVVSAVTVAVLAVTRVGAPVLRGARATTRVLTDAERRRAAWYRRSPVPRPHGPATWRDAGWLAALFPVALVCAIPTLVALVVVLAFATGPAWLWAVPNPHAPWFAQVTVTTWSGRLVASAVGLALLPVVARLVIGVADAQARLARAVLDLSDRERLTALADHLASTRAAVVDAQAAELKRIERDLHDGAQARIVAAGMTLALADRRLRTAAPEPGDDPVRDAVNQARRQLDEALVELRTLVRGIHPPILTDRGLDAALAALVADNPLDVALRVELDGPAPDRRPLPAAVEAAAYFVVAEALTNAAKHADATTCDVRLARDGGGRTLSLSVRDDGRGGADPTGAGLDGLRRRVEALDGSLTVVSPVGGPTLLQAELPCAS